MQTDNDDLELVLAQALDAAARLALTSPQERADALAAIATALEADADALIGLAMTESHLPLGRLQGELGRTTFQLRQIAQRAQQGACFDAVIEEADADFALGPRPDLRSVKIPIGPVLVYAASNFPFAFSVAGGDTASALAAGCPVVVKAHPGHPQLSTRTASLIAEALPVELSGSLQLIHGLEPGRRALLDSRIKAAAFTGSTPGGRALYDLAVSRPDPIPFYGELGSVNPTYVSPGTLDNDATALVEGFVGSFTLGVGQFCTKPGLLFVPEGYEIDKLLSSAVERVPPLPMLGDWVAERFVETAASLEDNDAISVLHDGGGEGIARSPLLLATSLERLRGSYEVLDIECFGPASIIVEYAGLDELLRVAESLEPSLTATIHATADEEEWARRLLGVVECQAGRLIVNGWPTGVAVSPAMHHGGPYPSSTAVQFSSVGGNAIERFLRPVCFQNLPDSLLPPVLQSANPWKIERRVNGSIEESAR
jgi:NADP-dependent aldehyde dehydrogenase